MVNSMVKSIRTEDDYYAKGTSINIVNETIEKSLKDSKASPVVLFFITDG